MFAEGKRQGEGTMRYASGEEETGNWKNGVLTSGEAGPAPDAEAPAAE